MIEIVHELPTGEVFEDYSRIPITYLVDSVFRATFDGTWRLTEEAIGNPFLKNYDEIENPADWPRQFDVSKWTILSAFDEGRRIGGTVLAWDTPGVDMLEGRSDLIVMWDLRIHPEYRRQAIGSQLFDNAVRWGRNRGCTDLKVETQDINVRACKFYAKMECELRFVRPDVYPGLSKEVQFLWYRKL